jgi:hypothetical protein
LGRPVPVSRGTRFRWFRRGAAFLALVATAALVTRFFGVRLEAPHRVLPEPETLNASKARELDDAMTREDPRAPEQVLRFALGFTGRSLYFGLGHPTRFVFPSDAPRAGNCVEYTYLFVEAFNVAARRAGLTVRARRVRSDARIWGVRIPDRRFTDHDWALVEDPTDGWKRYVDPAFDDALLGESLAANVRGTVPGSGSGEKVARDARFHCKRRSAKRARHAHGDGAHPSGSWDAPGARRRRAHLDGRVRQSARSSAPIACEGTRNLDEDRAYGRAIAPWMCASTPSCAKMTVPDG